MRAIDQRAVFANQTWFLSQGSANLYYCQTRFPVLYYYPLQLHSFGERASTYDAAQQAIAMQERRESIGASLRPGGLQSRFPHHIPFFLWASVSPLISASSTLQVFLSLSPVSELATKKCVLIWNSHSNFCLSLHAAPSVPTGRGQATDLSFTRHI